MAGAPSAGERSQAELEARARRSEAAARELQARPSGWAAGARLLGGGSARVAPLLPLRPAAAAAAAAKAAALR